jgi:N-acetyl-gamma-glutamyl-phosphate reductase
MQRLRVGVVGASGYSGSVAARLIAAHPHASLTFASSDRLAGESIAAVLGLQVDAGAPFIANAAALEHADGCDAVLLATPANVSLQLAPALAERGKQVVDLSGAFRLAASEYPRWYRFDHTAAALLERAHYGLPELFGPPPPQGTLVSNPGCYATAALLPLWPLLRDGLIEPSGILIDGKSGTTGAGRQSSEAHSFAEVNGDVRAYRLLTHQHSPEIARHLTRAARPERDVKLTLTAHLLPLSRGLLATCYARPRPGASAKGVAECLADAYAGASFVRAVPPEEVMLKRVAGTNLAQVGATADEDVVIALGAIDNLLKGAAGQAVQNLNLMNGWDETAGLSALQRFAP